MHRQQRPASASRREFLRLTAGALFAAAHHRALAGERTAVAATRNAAVSTLARLELLTSAPLESVRQFYGSVIGLPAQQADDGVTVRAGESILVFRHTTGAGNPFYHFAFNIPENKIEAARAWQLRRTPLLPIPARLRAAGMAPDIVDYRHWNAHSVFFLDPGGNVVEYIARHDLRNAAGGDFGVADILGASEIGLVVDDVPAAAARLREAFGLANYRAPGDDFTAVGDERGLLLVFRRGRILNFQPDSEEKAARVYPTRVLVRAPGRPVLSLEGYPYHLGAIDGSIAPSRQG